MWSRSTLASGSRYRSTLTITRCRAFFSKSWIPIEIRVSKFFKKMRRARPNLPAISTAERGCSVAAVMSALCHFELDVTRARPQVLAAVDDDGFARQRFCAHHEPDRIHHVLEVGAAAQRRKAMRAFEALLALLAAHQRDARGDAAHPHPWRHRHRQHPGRPF